MIDPNGRALAVMFEIYRATKGCSVAELSREFSTPKSTMGRWLDESRVAGKRNRHELAEALSRKCHSLTLLFCPDYMSDADLTFIKSIYAQGLKRLMESELECKNRVTFHENERISLADIFAIVYPEIYSEGLREPKDKERR